MSPALAHGQEGASRFPRVSGDEPFIKAPVDAMMSFSPRERG